MIYDQNDDYEGRSYGMRSNLRWSHLMADVTHFAGALDTTATVTIGRFTDVRIVGGQRRARRSDIFACCRVEAR